MSPGQTAFEGYVAWITYHLLLGESTYTIEASFYERFGALAPGVWGDALAAAFAGVNAAASAFGGPLDVNVGAFLPNGPHINVQVSVRMRVHFKFPDGTERWMIADLVAASEETMAQLYSEAITAAEQLAQRSGSSLVELDLLPPFYELT